MIGTLRFFPSTTEKNRTTFLSTVVFGYIFLFSLLGIIGVIVILMPIFLSEYSILILFCYFIVVTESFFNITRALARSQLNPMLYGILTLLKSFLTFIIIIALLSIGYGVKGAIYVRHNR